MMLKKLRFIALLLCVSLVPLAACVRQATDPDKLEVLRSGNLQEAPDDDTIADTVYVNVRDNTNRVFGLRAQQHRLLPAEHRALEQPPVHQLGDALSFQQSGAGLQALQLGMQRRA